MKRLALLLSFALLVSTPAVSQITWSYSTRDGMNYANGDSLHGHTRFRKLLGLTGTSTLMAGAAAGGVGQAEMAVSTIGAGDRAGVYFDSSMVSDTCSFQYVWKQNEDSSYIGPASALLYFGMNDTNITRWKGLAFRLSRHNSGGTNGGDYVPGFRRVDTTYDQPTIGEANLNAGGYALKQNDTLRIVKYGGTMYAYVAKLGGGGTVLLDSSAYAPQNAAWSFSTGRMAIRLRVSPTPPMLNMFMIGTKAGSAVPPPSTDAVPPVIYGETQSFSTVNTAAFTLSFGAYDSNTATQKNPGLDSMIIKFGTTYLAGVGGAPDTVIGDSLLQKCGSTKDTVVSRIFSAKPVGTYFFQFRPKDDTGNVTWGPRHTLVVGTATQNPFKVLGYFYTQTISSWGPAITSNHAIVGDLAANHDIFVWFYDNPDTLFPHLRFRVPDQGNAQYPNGSRANDSVRFFGIGNGSGINGVGYNLMAEIRDSVHNHGGKFVVCISAISGFAPATATQLQIICNDTTKSKAFAQTLALVGNLWKIDGWDFNWEFPNQSNRAFEFQFLKKLRDSLTAHSWNGQAPIIGFNMETQAVNPSNQTYDFVALDSLCDYVSAVSRDRFSYASPQYTNNPRGVKRQVIGDTHGLPGDTVKGFDGYSGSDSLFQNGQTYVTANGVKAGGVRASKAVQVLGFGAYEHWTGATGPGQPAAPVAFAGQLYESNGGSAAQTYLDQYWSPLHEWRDSSNNHFLAYKDAANIKHVYIFDDSVSLGEEIKMLKSRGLAGIMYNEAAWLQNAQGWRGNNDRLSFLHWMRTAANSSTFSTVGEPAPVFPVNGSTGQGLPSGGTITATFKWNVVPNAVEGYHISVSPDGKFFTAVTGGDKDAGVTTTDTTATVSGLAPSSTYYWKVVGRMGRFYGYYSKVKSFTTASIGLLPTTKPHKPVLLTPPNASIGQPTAFTLRWHQPTGVSDTVRSYWIQLSVDSTFATSFKYDSIVAPTQFVNADTQYVIAGLAQGARYFWHVKAINAGGDSGYSASFTLTTSSATPSNFPSYRKSSRYFNPDDWAFHNDATPPTVIRVVPLSQVGPPRKVSDNTIDTLTAYFTAEGIVFWDGKIYDFSKMAEYIFPRSNTFTAPQTLSGGASIGNLSLSGLLTTDIIPSTVSQFVGVDNLGNNASPFNGLYTNTAYRVYQRNGSYVTDTYATSNEMQFPKAGYILQEDWMYNGTSGITILPGNSVVSAFGISRFSGYGFSQTGSGSGVLIATPTPVTQDSSEPGVIGMTPLGCGTLGTANGGILTFRGNATFGSINARIQYTTLVGKFYVPLVADSLGYSSGYYADTSTVNTNASVTVDSAKAGYYLEGGGKLTVGQQATDSICAVSSNGSPSLRTKIRLCTAVPGHWYAWKITGSSSNAVFMVASDIDNFTTVYTQTIVTNLPANPTFVSPFNSVWGYDKASNKTVKFAINTIFLDGVKRGL